MLATRELLDRELVWRWSAAPALAETKRWIDEALANPLTRLFAAGDDSYTTSFVPDGFALVKMVSEYAETIERYEPGALAELARAGRVDGAAAARVTCAEGTKRCGRCDRSYSKLWIVGSTCVLCEQAARDAGRCPISPACPPGFFLPARARVPSMRTRGVRRVRRLARRRRGRRAARRDDECVLCLPRFRSHDMLDKGWGVAASKKF